MIFVFAHRHSKGDRFIEETRDAMKDCTDDLHFDFTVVRNVMYLYSKKAQEHYMTYPVESFFLAAFEMSSAGQSFIKTKPDSKEKTERILRETQMLRENAVSSLEKMGGAMAQ